MLPFEHEKEYLARWSLIEKFFCTRPNSKDGKPLIIRDYEGLKELSFLFFTGWIFCGVLNSAKDLVRPAILPMGKAGETSILALYERDTHLATPSWRGGLLLDSEFFVCPLDRAGRALTPTETHLCPVVNKLRYNLAHAKLDWDVSGLVEPARTRECCESQKALLWSYLSDTIRRDPDLYGPMVGGSAFPINLSFDLLSNYLTGINPGARDFGTLLEETLLWFAMAKSLVIMGGAHVTIERPFKSNEIDILIYECAGDVKPMNDPPNGWAKYVENHAICVMELTVGHRPEPSDGSDEPESSMAGALKADGGDSPKNKLINFLAFKSVGFKHVEFHYIHVISDSNVAGSTRQALKFTKDFQYSFLPEILGEDIVAAVLNHRDKRVHVNAVRRWHDALVTKVESIAEEFAKRIGVAAR